MGRGRYTGPMPAGPALDDRAPAGPAPHHEAGGPRRAREPPSPWMRILRIALVLGILGAVAAGAGLVGLFVYYGSDPKLPNLSRLDAYRPKQVTRILDRNGTPIGELGLEKRTVVPFDAIPKMLIQAVVAAEDADYFKHGGLDYRGMLRAFIENVLRGRTAQGGSTITQQVVKTLLLSPERTMRRKVQEIILARQLSQKLSKEDVLALYLNQIYYGHGRYGCEEAARYFFGKSVREVDLAEAALLAGLPQSPERLSPRKHPEAAKTRQRYVLGQMAEHGYIERKVAEKLAAEPIRLAREPSSARGTGGRGGRRDRRGSWSTSWASGPRSSSGTTVADHHRRAACRSWRAPPSSAGWRRSTRARATAAVGPPRPASRWRRSGTSWRRRSRSFRESDIFEGLVLRVDAAEVVDTTSTAPKRGARRGDAWSSTSGGEREGGGRSTSASSRATPKGTKPIAERFTPGDLGARARRRPSGRSRRGRPDAAGARARPAGGDGGARSGARARSWRWSAATTTTPAASIAPSARIGSRARRSSRSSTRRRSSRGGSRRRRSSTTRPRSTTCGSRRTTRRRSSAARSALRTALAHSINTVAISCCPTWASIRRAAVRGAASASPRRSAATWGWRWRWARAVTPLELANAYATFAERRVGGQPVADPRGRRREAAGAAAGAGAQARGRLRHDVAHAQRGRRGDGARRRAAS